MTIEEAINVLQRKSSIPCNGESFENDIEPAFNLAIEALRAQQERENQQPLTLEELRGMVGEAAWLVDTDGVNQILIFEKDFILEDGRGVHICALDDDGHPGLYDAEMMIDCGARFYRSKPEETQNGKM